MNNKIIPCPSCGAKNRIPMNKIHLRSKCGRCGHPLPHGAEATVIELGDHDFEQVVDHSPLPVLVDFYSPTCGPCRQLTPVIEGLARSYAGRVLICKLDTSRHQMTAARFQIRGVPTLLLFKNNAVVDQIVGAVPAAVIEQKLDACI